MYVNLYPSLALVELFVSIEVECWKVYSNQLYAIIIPIIRNPGAGSFKEE